MAQRHDMLPKAKEPKDLVSKIQGDSNQRTPSLPGSRLVQSASANKKQPLLQSASLPRPRFSAGVKPPQGPKPKPPSVHVPTPVSRPMSREALLSGPGTPLNKSVAITMPGSAGGQQQPYSGMQHQASGAGRSGASTPAAATGAASTGAPSLNSSLRRTKKPIKEKLKLPEINLKGLSKEAVAEVEEVNKTWGLPHALLVAAEAAVKMGFVTDIEKEFVALMQIGDKTRPMAPLDQIEDCDPWELMLGERSHNRCFSFGIDQQGQLGQGVSSRHYGLDKNAAIVKPPQSVKDGQKFVSVACGDHHTAAVTADGAVYQWGNNSCGELGLVARAQTTAAPRSDYVVLPGIGERQGSIAFASLGVLNLEEKDAADGSSFEEQLEKELCSKILKHGPVSLPQLPKAGNIASSPLRCWMGVPVTRVACGRAHTVAALEYSGVLVWGCNDAGQLGLGDTENRRQPVLLPAFDKIKVVELSAGKAHNLAIDYDMRLWAWGSNRSGQCAKADTRPVKPYNVRLPDADGFPKYAAAGQAHSLVSTNAGELYTWGYDAWGALGRGPRESGSPEVLPYPGKIVDAPPCFKVAAGAVSMAITKEGQLLVWGCHKWISHPKREDQEKRVPMPLDWMKEEKIASVACSRETAVAFSEEGAIHIWGRKQKLLSTTTDKQQGVDDGGSPEAAEPNTIRPTQLQGEGVAELSSGIVMDAACGDGYCAVLTEREIWDVPYSTLRRTINAVWEKYRIAHMGDPGTTKQRRRRGGDDGDDGVMSFQTFMLLTKEIGLVSNAVGLKELIDLYEDCSRERVNKKNTKNLPQFLDIAAAAAKNSPLLAKKSFRSLSSSSFWDDAVAPSKKKNKATENAAAAAEEKATDPVSMLKRLTNRKSKNTAVEALGVGGKMKVLSQAIAQEMQARVSLLEMPVSFAESLTILTSLVKKAVPDEEHETELLRIVAGQMGSLKERDPEGPSFLLRQSCSPTLAKTVVQTTENTLLLRIYGYLMSENPERDDLNLKVEDLKPAMTKLGDRAGITAMRMATFCREAALVPKVVAQYISFIQQREDPELYELAQFVAMSSSRLDNKALGDKINKDALKHRDRILAEALLTMHGPVPKLDPECLDFEDFVSIILILVVVKSLCSNNRVESSKADEPDATAQTQIMKKFMDKIKRYREKKLHPWKYVDRPRSDAELEQEIDRIFSMYCTLDTSSYNVEVDQKSFMKLAKDAKIVDNKITITRLDLMFLGAVNEVRNQEARDRGILPTRHRARARTDFLAQPKKTPAASGSGSDTDTSPTRQRPPTGASNISADSRASSAVSHYRRTPSTTVSTPGKVKTPNMGGPGGAQLGRSMSKKFADVMERSDLSTMIKSMKDGEDPPSTQEAGLGSVALAALSQPVETRSKIKQRAAKSAAAQGSQQQGFEDKKRQLHSRRMLEGSGKLSVRRESSGTAVQFENRSKRDLPLKRASGLSVEERGGIGQAGKAPKKLPNAVPRDAFGRLIRSIAEQKYSKERDPWRALVEKHFLSLSHSALDRYDNLMEQLLDPDVTEMAEAYSSMLQHVFKIYCTMDGSLAYSHAEVTWAMMEEANNTLSFQEYCLLANDYGIVPNLVTIKELESIFRRANFTENSEDSMQIMNYSEFIDSLCLIALHAFSKDDVKNKYPTTVDKLKALYAFMGFKPGRADPVKEEKKVAEDEAAYRLWYDLEGSLDFYGGDCDDDGKGKSWYYSSTTQYPMCLIPEVVSTPDSPPEVAEHLDRASKLHGEGKFVESLNEYNTAQEVWSHLTAEQQLTRSRDLAPEAKIFFAAAMGAVLTSNGEDAAALHMYMSVEKEVRKLPDDHPDTALLHSLIGAANYHMRNYEEAYRRFVRAKVTRDFLPTLGRHHVDSAIASNNLACVLDKGGQVGHAMFLLQDAHKTILRLLGGNHPRAMMVERNLGHLKHRTFSFEELPTSLDMHPANLLASQRVQSSGGRRHSAASKPASAKKVDESLSRLERLHKRIERRVTNKAPVGKKKARKHAAAASSPQALVADLYKQYHSMAPEVARTRLGLYNDKKGKIISGVADGELSQAVQLMMMLGYNVKLREPEKKLKVDRVKVRTTKKFAQAVAKNSRTKVGANGEIEYNEVRDEDGHILSRKEVARRLKLAKDAAEGIDAGSDSSSDESDSSSDY